MSFANKVKSMGMGMPVNSVKPMANGMKMSPSMKAADGEPDADERGAASDKDADDAGNQLTHALRAHKAGDHAKAKKHALNAVNQLHSMTKQSGLPIPPNGGTGDLSSSTNVRTARKNTGVPSGM